MPNRSIVAPLLLIGIGVLFLARNVFPELALLDYLALYWPYLLILWGALRLIEVVLWKSSGRPLPRAGLSGGEWVLVIFVCLAGMSLHAVRGYTTWLPRAGVEWGGLEVFGETFDYPVAAELASSATPRVVLEDFRGSARIHAAAAGETAVKVTGQNRVRSMDQASADRAQQQAALEVSGGPDQVVIRTHQERVSGIRRLTADLDITVPPGASIVAHGRDGGFDISGLTGTVELTARDSNVRLEAIGGEVLLELQGGNLLRAVDLRQGLTVKGSGHDVDLDRVAGPVTFNAFFTGLVQWRALAGPIRWQSPQTEIFTQGLPGDLRMTSRELELTGVTGPTRIQSRNRDIAVNNYTGTLDLSVERGDVRLVPPAAGTDRVSVKVEAGDVELALPDGGRFTLNAITRLGGGVNDYGTPVVLEPTRNGANLSTPGDGAGGPAIAVTVQRGQIQVRKSSAGERSPGSLFPQLTPGAVRGKGPAPDADRKNDRIPRSAPAQPVDQ